MAFLSYETTRRNQRIGQTICMGLVQNIFLFENVLSRLFSGSMCDDSQSFILIYKRAWLCEDQGVKMYFHKITYYDMLFVFLKLSSLITLNSLILLLNVIDL